jgi:hypothetical protein
MHALELRRKGLTMEEVYALREEYLIDKENKPYNKVTKDFYTYTEHKGKWLKARQKFPNITFEDYVNSLN